jgi:predicted sulfurtransferase
MKKEKKQVDISSDCNGDSYNDGQVTDGTKHAKKSKKKKKRVQSMEEENEFVQQKVQKSKKRTRSLDKGNVNNKNNNDNVDHSVRERSFQDDNIVDRRNKDTADTNTISSDTKEVAVAAKQQQQQQEEFSLSHPRPLVESSALPTHMIENKTKEEIRLIEQQQYPISILLFYQYVSPMWNDSTYKMVQEEIYTMGTSLSIHGRIRVAKEGLNCTLSGTKENVRQFCSRLREWKPTNFHSTEFKITHHLEIRYHFPALKIIPVLELVHYGLDGGKTISTVPSPEILEQYSGTHLEPLEYHQKLAEPNTVIIDVRNHYEAAIGHFHVPSSAITTAAKTVTGSNHHQKDDNHTATSFHFLDPKMRKSTEFPIWLDHPSTKEQLKGKQVLMYCTGGIRCERASALLQYKIQNDPSVQELNIQGVYQLQGGIDKYFKEFPDGGYWVGKNYTFDKRCAHKPVEASNGEESPTVAHEGVIPNRSTEILLGKCAACYKPWDNYGGKPCRCPTCGVPNLICKDCFTTKKKKKIKNIRCDLCVEQNVLSKKELRDKELQELMEFEQRNQSLLPVMQPQQQHNTDSSKSETKPTKKANMKTIVSPNSQSSSVSNDHTKYLHGTTRLYLRNMCRNTITEEKLLEVLPGITHIVWKIDGKSGTFFGQAWVEMESPDAAEYAVSQSGKIVVCGRTLYIDYQPPDGKDLWPPPRSAVNKK